MSIVIHMNVTLKASCNKFCGVKIFCVFTKFTIWTFCSCNFSSNNETFLIYGILLNINKISKMNRDTHSNISQDTARVHVSKYTEHHNIMYQGRSQPFLIRGSKLFSKSLLYTAWHKFWHQLEKQLATLYNERHLVYDYSHYTVSYELHVHRNLLNARYKARAGCCSWSFNSYNYSYNYAKCMCMVSYLFKYCG